MGKRVVKMAATKVMEEYYYNTANPVHFKMANDGGEIQLHAHRSNVEIVPGP